MPTTTRDWQAWLDTMPPGPHHLHVTGEVLVPNPGIEATLTPTEPQGVNPLILLLGLHLAQKPGDWPQVFAWVPARYEKTMTPQTPIYKEVQIIEGAAIIERLPVHVAQ
jgi:hypothetical protein